MIETYSLNIFRCKLCSEVILAEHKSSTCPFCGAHDDFIVYARDWKDENHIKEISDASRKNLENAMRQELENAGTYKCSASSAQNAENKAIFSGLSKIEMEHAFLISKILKLPKSNIKLPNACFRLDIENLETSFKREEQIKKFYIKAYNQATEPRIKEIFFGLIEVEGDHAELLKERIYH
jgi:rubrerythrin